jgi:small subunit ribosomal protein S2
MTNTTIRQMLEAGVHFGHQVRYWNPKMASYIFGIKSKIHIIDLEKTLPLYEQAVNFLSSIAAKKGKILFVGTKHQARSLLRDEAKRCRMPYVDFRWLGGMLTNYKTIRQSLKRLKELEDLRDSQTFSRITKKEALSIMREINKLEKSLGGVREMGGLPDALFVIDVGHEKIAVSEAAKLKIPIVGIVDTNNSPDDIDYIIPGNDDSVRAIKLYLQAIVDAIIDARGSIIEEEVIAEKEDNEKKGGKRHPLPKKKVFKKKATVEDKSNVQFELNAPEVTSSKETTESVEHKPEAHKDEEHRTKVVKKPPVHKVSATKIKRKHDTNV